MESYTKKKILLDHQENFETFTSTKSQKTTFRKLLEIFETLKIETLKIFETLKIVGQKIKSEKFVHQVRENLSKLLNGQY